MSEAILVKTVCYTNPLTDEVEYIEAGQHIAVDLIEHYAVWGESLFSVEPGEYRLFN